MSQDFITDLLDALSRVASPDADRMKEILILSGMPEKTENLRYLSFNREAVSTGDRSLEFSAGGVINNREAGRWRLEGFWKKASRILFGSSWTRNPLDFFLNNLRCNDEMMKILGAAEGAYTLLGILEEVKKPGSGLFRRKIRFVRPVVAISGLQNGELEKVSAFEKSNEIRKTAIPGASLYRK